MNPWLNPVLMQLAHQTPGLIVYLAGIVLAAVLWRRSPVPCLLTLLACGLLLAVNLVQTISTQWLIVQHSEGAWEVSRLSAVMTAVSFIGTFFRAVGVALLLAAVFVGRRAPAWQPPEAALADHQPRR